MMSACEIVLCFNKLFACVSLYNFFLCICIDVLAVFLVRVCVFQLNKTALFAHVVLYIFHLLL